MDHIKKLQIGLKVKNVHVQKLSYSIKGPTTSSGTGTFILLLIPILLLMLSYTQNETIFPNKHPKDPTELIKILKNKKLGLKNLKPCNYITPFK